MKVCLFVHHSDRKDGKLPNYVKVYLEELEKSFDKIVLIYNPRELDEKFFFDRVKVELFPTDIGGYDFGKWYAYIKKRGFPKAEYVALVNDSCIPLRSIVQGLDTLFDAEFDYSGLMDSVEYNYHIQSYFILIRDTVAKEVESYFLSQGVPEGREDCIHNYELKLSKTLQEAGHRLGALYSHENYDTINPVYAEAPRMLRDGFPLVKRKMVFQTDQNIKVLQVNPQDVILAAKEALYCYNGLNYNIRYLLEQ